MCEEPPAIEQFNTLLDAQSSSPTGARARQPPIHSGLGLPIPIEGASRQANQPTQGSNWVHRLHCMGVDGLGCSRGWARRRPASPHNANCSAADHLAELVLAFLHRAVPA
jgi:hypothetical protein